MKDSMFAYSIQVLAKMPTDEVRKKAKFFTAGIIFYFLFFLAISIYMIYAYTAANNAASGRYLMTLVFLILVSMTFTIVACNAVILKMILYIRHCSELSKETVSAQDETAQEAEVLGKVEK